MDKLEKDFLFHVSNYMKNDFVSQDDFDRLTMWIRYYIKYTVAHEYGDNLPLIFVPHIKLGFSHFLFLRYASDAGGRYFKELCDMIKRYFLSPENRSLIQ